VKADVESDDAKVSNNSSPCSASGIRSRGIAGVEVLDAGIAGVVAGVEVRDRGRRLIKSLMVKWR
jgi:hypothetical protein